MKNRFNLNLVAVLFPSMCLSLILDAQDNWTAKGIKFEQGLSWVKVKAKAKAENKYIFVDVFATWCGPCKRMDKEVYSNDSVGNIMNGKFISVKVQADTSAQDMAWVKNWYIDARQILKEYEIPGYPSFLFFSPDAKLAYKDLGYKNVSDFIKQAERALDPQNIIYYSRLEDYKRGIKQYKGMDELAIFTKKIICNKELATIIAKDYKDSYLDKFNEEALCTKENLTFIGMFNNLINSKDPFFRLCYTQPEKVDQLIGNIGWAKFQVEQTVTKEEMENKLLKDKKPIYKNPDWNQIRSVINKKYKKLDANRLLLGYQIIYYRFNDLDWRLWAIYKDKKIKDYPPEAIGLGVYIELNTYGAWDAFLHCNDKRVLTRTLTWIDQALQSDKENKAAYLDTKANLLYKLGKVEQAINTEEKAMEIDSTHSFNIVVTKMKNGEPTYLEEGAIWNTCTLPKKGNQR